MIRHLPMLLRPELAWPGHHRRTESVGEAVADLYRETYQAFADVEHGSASVTVTLHARQSAQDGLYRPRLAWMVGLATYPILTALGDMGVNVEQVTYRRCFTERGEAESIEVEVR